jgi:hypothetical protein
MDWKNRSDQPQSRYEPDEGDTFEETDFIDASSYGREGTQPAAVPPADHASYDQPVTDPVFANRGTARRERQGSFSTQRLGGGGRNSGNRRSLPLLLLLGTLIAIPLIAGLWWLLNRDGDTPTAASPVPSPVITVTAGSPSASPSSSTSPSGSASARPSTSASPSVSASPSTAPGTFVVAGEGLRLREGPSSTANIITTLAEGTQVQATGVTTNADGREWRQVRVNGSEGWAADEFLRPAP